MDYLAIYPEMMETLNALPADKAFRMIQALMAYAVEGIAPEFDDQLLAVVWIGFRQQIDRIKANVEKNRSNGAKGGRPAASAQQQKPKETQHNPTKPNETQNNPTKAYHHQTDIDTEKDKEIDIYYNHHHHQEDHQDQGSARKRADDDDDYRDVLRAAFDAGCRDHPAARKQIIRLCKEYDVGNVLCGIEAAVSHNATSLIAYLQTVLQNSGQPKPTGAACLPRRKTVTTQNYQQREYADDAGQADAWLLTQLGEKAGGKHGETT